MIAVRFKKFILSVTVIAGLILALSFWLTSAKNPEVVLLYTQKSNYPDLAFRLSSVPIAIASLIQSKHRVFAILPASRENIERAFATARAVVIGTHGSDGGILSDDGGWIGPDARVSVNMKLIYFGSCYFGERRDQWQNKFPSAKVIGHDSLTDPLEGWMYLVFQSWQDLWGPK